MNALDFFFENVADEFGNRIKFSNLSKGFTGVVCFDERSADIYINSDSYTELDNDLNDHEKAMLNAFVEYTQSEMKSAKAYLNDIQRTENSLCK